MHPERTRRVRGRPHEIRSSNRGTHRKQIRRRWLAQAAGHEARNGSRGHGLRASGRRDHHLRDEQLPPQCQRRKQPRRVRLRLWFPIFVSVFLRGVCAWGQSPSNTKLTAQPKATASEHVGSLAFSYINFTNAFTLLTPLSLHKLFYLLLAPQGPLG